MRWYEISSSNSTDDIYYLTIYSTRHQGGWTALHHAATKGHIEVARLLFERGADVNSEYKVSDVR